MATIESHEKMNEVLDAPSSFALQEASVRHLSLREPMVVSFGTFDSRPSGWAAITCSSNGETATGYGEGATLPKAVFTSDSGENIAQNIERLCRHISDSTTGVDAINRVNSYKFTDGNYYPTARLAVESAILDGVAKVHNTSIRELIGIPHTTVDVPYGKSIGGSTTESILRQTEQAIEQNAKKIKLKISPELFGPVIRSIDLIQQHYPDVSLMVDANGSFDPNDKLHQVMITALDNRALMMLEEPVSRIGEVRGIDAARALRNNLPALQTPICLDDCLKTQEDCEQAISEGVADIINIKPGRIGSFLQSLQLAQKAKSMGAEVMVGGMLEGTPGRCMTTLLGAYCLSLGFKTPGDLSLAQERLSSDFVPTEKQLSINSNGNITLPTGNGWGF